MTSQLSSTFSNNPSSDNREGIVLQGYHKKLKTMKKKYFVLHADNGTKKARLSYYDSEKKFKARANPKREIQLNSCFNINRRLDTKHHFVIALSTSQEVFCIVLETETELNRWLRALIALQRGEDTESDPPKPFFQHIWQVQIQRKGIAEEKGLLGKYYVCLTTKSVTLMRIGSEKTSLGETRPKTVEFYLTTIRRCGDSQCFFFMEVGRHSALGAGELWMQTEDALIAQNMHTMIISAMSYSKNVDDSFGPISRKRSSSANEASKPISMTYRRQTHSGTKPMNSSPLNVVAMGRDRCDSLPSSRNRTASECSNSQPVTNSSMPPPTRPLSNRPMSMCIGNRHHSPPLSTLSPSTGCSESDGSSLSIDEPDCARPMTPDESGNFVGRHYNSHSSDGVIPEENYDDGWFLEKNSRMLDNMNNANGRLTLPISTTHSIHSIRKSSPAASQAGSVDMQSQYMDMFSPYSPSGNSPCDQSGFMPVSPSTDFPRGLYTGSSGGHSRASSLAEETVDGYVPMCPPPLQDYVDMEQSSKNHTTIGGLSSAASSCSITSGTPSTDIRFAEYSLDKVKSRFTPDDEDLHPASERPIRAYSVGSRPEHIKRKLRVDAPNTADQNNSRVRAFSVGSRATKVPRCDLYRNALGTNTLSCHVNNNNININNNLSDILASNNKNKKSSSAPILVHKSQNSVDRMSDLMEIDFSKNSESINHNTSNMSNSSQHQSHSHSQTTTASVRYQSFPSSVPSAQQKRDFFENSPKANSSGYLEMKPGSYTEKPSPTTGHKSMDSGYLEMRPIGVVKTSSLSSSPIKASTSVPKSISSVAEEANYTNMSPVYSNLERMSSEDYMNMSPHDRHWDMDNVARQTTSTPDGYMEMTFGKGRNSDNDIANNRGLMGVNRLGEPRNVSSPIDIVSKEKSFGSGFTELFSRKTRRSDSHDGDIIAPIPLHPSTIFPFSPGSPVKKGFIQNDLAQRKCLVDATSGTITLSEQKVDGETSCYSKSSIVSSLIGQSSVPDKEKILNIDTRVSKKPVASVEALSNDYADMSLGQLKSNCKSNETDGDTSSSDYVNYTPSSATSAPKPNKSTSSNRIAAFGKKINPLNMSNKKQPLVTIAGGANDTTNTFTGFKPISSSTDEPLIKSNLRGANSPKNVNRQLSDQTRLTDDNSSGYELLQMRSDSSLQTKKILSRPNSVNSEKISPSKSINRPNSANSECMPSISTSSSTSTLCGSSSSSSTLCGSKSQSPLTSSRPQSFSDTIAGGASSSSRPDSVSSIADPVISSRPPSVSSERELHYASLDLPPSSNTIINSPTNNADGNSNSNAKANSSTSGESSTSPSPNASGGQQQPTFVYAQIDFNKCENLKLAMNAANNQKNQ